MGIRFGCRRHWALGVVLLLLTGCSDSREGVIEFSFTNPPQISQLEGYWVLHDFDRELGQGNAFVLEIDADGNVEAETEFYPSGFQGSFGTIDNSEGSYAFELNADGMERLGAVDPGGWNSFLRFLSKSSQIEVDLDQSDPEVETMSWEKRYKENEFLREKPFVFERVSHFRANEFSNRIESAYAAAMDWERSLQGLLQGEWQRESVETTLTFDGFLVNVNNGLDYLFELDGFERRIRLFVPADWPIEWDVRGALQLRDFGEKRYYYDFVVAEASESQLVLIDPRRGRDERWVYVKQAAPESE